MYADNNSQSGVVSQAERWPSIPPPPEEPPPWLNVTPPGTASIMQSLAEPGIQGRQKPENWPDPQPLVTKAATANYPLAALPDTIRAAVEEVRGFVQCPIPLAASCALAAVSIATQAHYDVERSSGLQGPVSLFLLTIAESGERKTSCDSHFMRAVKLYEAEQAEAAIAPTQEYNAKISAWEAKQKGLTSAIQRSVGQGRDTGGLEADMEKLMQSKPEPPRIPRLLYNDATPEALSWGLAKEWPSGGVCSSEGGVVLGGHAMGTDSIVRNLARLNLLWDGEPLNISRRTSESFTVRGARLTVGLQVQEGVIREFHEKAGALARGSGFWARFLIGWPETTQGTRLFKDPPKDWPALAAFNARILEMLKSPEPMDETSGGLKPTLLTLSGPGKAAWIQFHDTVEHELLPGGELDEVRDVAAKAADSAARLAALFEVFETGAPNSEISLTAMERASAIVTWHLNEARRFFGELAQAPEMIDAGRLDEWLCARCQAKAAEGVSTREAQQYGPVRNKLRLDNALEVLNELGRFAIRDNGRKRGIHINPRLFEARQ